MQVLLLETNSKALQRALERKGFKVDVAHDAVDVDRRVNAGSYGVIVLDRELLNGGDFELLKKWRNSITTAGRNYSPRSSFRSPTLINCVSI